MATSVLKTRRRIADIAFTSFCWVTAAIALSALAAILWSLLVQGIGGLNLNVFTMSTPAQGSTGGLLNAIVGSALMCAVAMVLAVSVGVLAGTWLAEYGANSVYAQFVRFVSDILLSAPSVLVGVVIWMVLVKPFGGFSALAGSVALAVIALPIITRTTEDVLRLQPTSLRESGMALGTPMWTTIRTILWKSASTGMLTAILLAFARISGETAPLLFTALGNQFFSLNLTQPMANLPVVIYNFALSADDGWQKLAWAGALIIAVAVLSINIVARIVGREQRRS
jgi:phosphate transport system permease protein